MPSNLPESEIPDVREYVYVDEGRVQSLLAQMSDGAPVERETGNSRSRRVRMGLKALEWERGSDQSGSERLTTADLHVSMLEDAATSLGMLADVSEAVMKEKFWKRGKVRGQLAPGMIVRITAPTQLIDPRSISNTMRVFNDAISSDDDEFNEILEIANALYGESLSLSIRPTPSMDNSCAFLGLIPHSHSFTPLQRDLLFSRFGPDLPELTSIVQIARVPTERESTLDVKQQIERLAEEITTDGGESVNRTVFDDLMVQMGRAMEEYGLQSAPKWPSISVVPLAIYRAVMPSSPLDLDDDDDDDKST